MNPNEFGWGPIQVKAIAEAVLDRMTRLGLTWRLRPATITAVASNGVIRGVYDADTTSVRLVSLVGPVAAGARVMVLRTPPAGNHIIGWAGTPSPGTGPDALAWSDRDSPTITTQTVVLSTPVLLRARTAYRVEIGGGIAGDTRGALADLRLQRAATASQATQTVGQWRIRDSGNCDTVRYIRRTADTDLPVTIELSLEPSNGTITHIGAAGRPRYLQITACGEAARWPHATAVNG